MELMDLDQKNRDLTYIYNLNTLKVEEVYQANVYYKTIKIYIPNIFTLSFKEYMKKIRDILYQSLVKDTITDYTVFDIRFAAKEDLTSEDMEHFYNICSTELCKLLTINAPREREQRLSVDNLGIRINKLPLLKMVNNKTIIDIFSINFYCRGYVISMLEEVNNDK